MKIVLMSAGIAGDFEKIQFLELDVLVLDKCFQSGDRAVPVPSGWFLVPEHVTERVLFSFHQINHRARDRLFALEGGDLGSSPNIGLPWSISAISDAFTVLFRPW